MTEHDLRQRLQALHPRPPAVDWAGTAALTGQRRLRRGRQALAGLAASSVVVASIGVLDVVHQQGSRPSTATPTTQQRTRQLEALAVREITEIQQGTCGPTAALFDARIKPRLDAAQLCATFVNYTTLLGSLVRIDPATSSRRGDVVVVRVPLVLTYEAGEYRVSFRPEG